MKYLPLVLVSTVLTVYILVLAASPSPEKVERMPRPAADQMIGLWESGDGALITIKRVNDGYRVQWNREASLPDLGIGMKHGNALYVGYQTVTKTSPGIVRYELEDGKLVGEWMNSDGHSATETLTRIK